MPAKKTATTAATYELRITVQEILPPIWRLIHVPGSMRLGKLHDVIQVVMGWTDSHLHQFEKDGKYWSAPDHFEDEDFEVLDEAKAPLAEVLPAEGDSLVYVYDFGDNWRHDVSLERILPANLVERPVCVGGARHCPPEDVGGVPGYEQFLDVIFDPTHEDYRSMVTWAGGPFQAEEFELGVVNAALARMRFPVKQRR